ncbi:hypothetical protein [Ruminococcus flavefaciens]|uniref:hypothetical protein n=1 Tax=Ruminococcus flavefaciens TaxID=1265 RepID=UPI0026F26E79|nr:hypothetical protein [Ruminococcus flavefaciens]MDD7515128.1 hypothetical protein [Ruminococcus flavefaciens]MDY5691553.1 hypothetical protein [Ruminococcus flavefaciens]
MIQINIYLHFVGNLRSDNIPTYFFFFIIIASTAANISRYSDVNMNRPAYVAIASRTVPLYSASGEKTLISGAASSIITVSNIPVKSGTSTENMKKNRLEKLPSCPPSSCMK